MREILFRGKRLDNGEWVEGDLVHSVYKIGDTCVGTYGSSLGMHQVDPSTVGQYTGLLDKNGERIFEGDILLVDGEDGYFKLEFEEDTAQFVMQGDMLVVDFDNFWSYEVEVIGTVHDNPELLEGGEAE